MDRYAQIDVKLNDNRIQSGSVVWKRRRVKLEGRLVGSAEVGFQGRGFDAAITETVNIELDRPERSCGLVVGFPDGEVHSIAAPHMASEVFARLRALPIALSEIWKTRDSIHQFLKSGDQTCATGLRRRYGLTPVSDKAVVIPDDLLTGVPSLDTPPTTVVIPVFNAASDVERLLTLLPSRVSLDTRIVLIDDGSDDPRIGLVLQRFASKVPGAKIIRHSENRGFVAAANRGMAEVRSGDHVVLLNSDTIPPRGWLPRLLAPIVSDPDHVASTTPFSNNAEILSVPTLGIVTEPDEAFVDAVDQLAATLKPNATPLPTGIGFCMALNRKFLDSVGPFDPEFGRGYGEETDWCQRASLQGGVHLTAPLFVGHRGAASFGNEKAQLRQSAGAIVSARYPDYDRKVQRWISNPPTGAEILALSLGWLETTSEEVPIFLGHSLGGGAENALQAEVKKELDSGTPAALVVRVGGPLAWRIELCLKDLTLVGDTSAKMLVLLLGHLSRKRIIYSCGVGAAEPMSVPVMLDALCAAPETRFEIRLHDFFAVSPSWNLLNDAGQFCGCPAHDTSESIHQPGGADNASHAMWRKTWGELIDRAEAITAFAPSGEALFCEAYPNAVEKIDCKPHDLPNQMPQPIAPGGETIGVLGGINLAKGGAVIEALALTSKRRIVVIGEMDGRFRLRKPHLVHGRYDRDRITQLARTYEIGLWLVPSVCPETFSFATHEALATNLPVVSFDLGAQADALRDAINGHVLPIEPSDTERLSAAIEEIFALR